MYKQVEFLAAGGAFGQVVGSLSGLIGRQHFVGVVH
jgi:hypothetical protein